MATAFEFRMSIMAISWAFFSNNSDTFESYSSLSTLSILCFCNILEYLSFNEAISVIYPFMTLTNSLLDSEIYFLIVSTLAIGTQFLISVFWPTCTSHTSVWDRSGGTTEMSEGLGMHSVMQGRTSCSTSSAGGIAYWMWTNSLSFLSSALDLDSENLKWAVRFARLDKLRPVM